MQFQIGSGINPGFGLDNKSFPAQTCIVVYRPVLMHRTITTFGLIQVLLVFLPTLTRASDLPAHQRQELPFFRVVSK